MFRSTLRFASPFRRTAAPALLAGTSPKTPRAHHSAQTQSQQPQQQQSPATTTMTRPSSVALRNTSQNKLMNQRSPVAQSDTTSTTADVDRLFKKAKSLHRKGSFGNAVNAYRRCYHMCESSPSASWETLAAIGSNYVGCMSRCGVDLPEALSVLETVMSLYITNGREGDAVLLSIRHAQIVLSVVSSNSSTSTSSASLLDTSLQRLKNSKRLLERGKVCGQLPDVNLDGMSLFDPTLLTVVEAMCKHARGKLSLKKVRDVVDAQGKTSVETHFVSHRYLAKAFLAEGDLKAADECFAKAARVGDSSEWQTFLDYALMLHHVLNDPGRAVPLYKRATAAIRSHLLWDRKRAALSLSLPNCLLNLGAAYQDNGENELALPLLTEALRLFLDDKTQSNRTVRLHLLVGQCFVDTGNVDEAETIFASAVDMLENRKASGFVRAASDQIDVNFQSSVVSTTEVFTRYAKYLCQTDDFDRAEVYFTKAISYQVPFTPPQVMVELYEAYASMLREMGEEERAIGLEDAMVSISEIAQVPMEASIWLRRAVSLEGTPRGMDVIEAYERALSTAKSEDLNDEAQRRELHADVCVRYATFLQNKNDHKRAYEIYEEGLLFSPDNAHFFVQQAWCAHSLGVGSQHVMELLNKAVAAIERTSAEKKHHQWDSCYVFGEFAVYHHDVLNDSTAASTMYERALVSENSASENYPQVAANYAVLLNSLGRCDEATRWFAAATAVKPPHYGAWILLLDSLIHQQHAEEAHATASQILSLFPAERTHVQMRIAKLFEMNDPANVQQIVSAYLTAMRLGCVAWHEDMSLETLCHTTVNIQAVAEYASILNYRLRKLDDAETCYRALRVRLPSDSNVAVHYARMLLDNHISAERAMMQFTEVLQMEPGNLFVLDYFADLYSRGDDSIASADAAEDCHLQSLRLCTSSTAATPSTGQRTSGEDTDSAMMLHAKYHFACNLLCVAKDVKRAGELFETCAAANPDDAIALSGLATFLLHKQDEDTVVDVDRVQSLYERVIKLEPTNVNHLQQYATFLIHKPDFPAAAVQLTNALRLEPKNMDLLRLVAQFLSLRYHADNDEGYVEQADRVFTEMFKIDAHDVASLFLYSGYLATVKKDKNASDRVEAYAAQLQKQQEADHSKQFKAQGPFPNKKLE
eukprot:PhM_4_TR15943/c0_g1_i3/m.50178